MAIYSRNNMTYDDSAIEDAIKKARAAGVPEAQIQQSAMQYRLANRLDKPAQKVSGRGGTLTSLISEGGALGGATAGGAIGTSILPGVGTLVGAGIGGLIGGFGGRVAENKVRDDRIGLKDAAIEGTISGVTAALPLGALAKSGKILVTGGGKTAAKDALQQGIAKLAKKEVGKTAEKGILKKVSTTGTDLEARAMGIGSGVKAGPGEILNRETIKPLLGTLDELGIKPGSPINVAEKLQTRLDGVGEQLGSIYKTADRKLTGIEKLNVYNDATKQIEKIPNLSKSEIDEITNQVKDDLLNKYNSITELFDAKKGLDAQISYVANPDAAQTIKLQANKAYRNAITNMLNELVPGVSDLNKQYSKITEILPMVSQASKGASSLSSGIVSNVISSNAAKGAQAKLGLVLEKSAGAASSAVNTSRPIRGSLAYLAKNKYAQNALAPSDATAETPQLDSMLPPEMMLDQNVPTETPDPISRLRIGAENALAAGDMESATKLAAMAEQFAGLSGQGVNATQEKALMGTDTASRLIDVMENDLAAIGTAGRFGGNIAKLSGKSGLNAQAQAYEQSRPSLALMLVKSIQGSAGSISDSDRAAIEGAIPSVSDTEEERRLKTNRLRDLVNAYRSAATTNQLGVQ